MKILAIIMCIGLVSCGPNVGVINTLTYCPAPLKPKYEKNDNATHIGSDVNLSILGSNIEQMKTYTDLMNATIQCYYKQLPKEQQK